MDGKTWILNLGVSLNAWLSGQNVWTRELLASEIKVSERTMKRVIAGEYFIAEKSDPHFYAKLFRITRLSECDPRSIPPRNDGIIRAWTNDQLFGWWNMYFPHEIDNSDVVSLFTNKAERIEDTFDSEPDLWLLELLKKLEQLCQDTEERREFFYVKNRNILGKIGRLIRLLNQPKLEREESIKLTFSLFEGDSK